MSIWFLRPSVEQLNERTPGSMVKHIGIEFVEIGDDYLRARMPVDERTVQPQGLLHGGASVTLAETLGSTAATLCVDPSQYMCVGIEINANHIRAKRTGYVYGTATPVHIGSTTHVWDIRVLDEDDKPVCVSRLTLAVLRMPGDQDVRSSTRSGVPPRRSTRSGGGAE